MWDLSSQKILIDKQYKDPKFFRDNNIPIPIFFAIPTLAFHVSLTRSIVNRNFIQETILYLKRNGMPKNEIADNLCLSPKLVDIIIENSRKDQKDTKSENDVIIEEKGKTEDFYIFYDLVNQQFIKGFMWSNAFINNISPMQNTYYVKNQQSYYHRDNLGDSYATKIHMIKNVENHLKTNVKPRQEDIIECFKEDFLFDDEGYLNTRYLEESYEVYLTVGYSVTPWNQNEFSVLNPFKPYVSFSSYLSKTVIKHAIDTESLNDIRDYQENTQNNLIKQQNKMMSIRTDRELVSFQLLSKKYQTYGYFRSNKVHTDFEVQMVKMQSSYEFISKNQNKDLRDEARKFYDFANNVIEQLLIITYEPFLLLLPEQLKDDAFFDALGREKTYEGGKIILNRYFEGINSIYDLSRLLKTCSTDNITRIIKSKNLNSDKAFKPGIKDLFVVNILATFYNRKSNFNRLFNEEIPLLVETILQVEETRQNIRHSFKNVSDNVKNIVETVYNIIDVILDVKNQNIMFELPQEESSDYTNYIGKYTGLDDITPILQESCNQLLMDIYNASELYLSDCVVAFENASKVIIEYVMRSINSIADLKILLEKISDDEDTAKLHLMELLEKNNIYIKIEKLSLDISNAKKALINNYTIKKASTTILFAPLLLAVMDYPAFITLFKNLGSEYLTDATDAVDRRGHSKQRVDWNLAKSINDRFLNYCKILTLFEKEEL
jgi:hypothetical protein